MTPEVNYGVSMTSLKAFANFFCGGLFLLYRPLGQSIFE
jgi:hypothetical protein